MAERIISLDGVHDHLIDINNQHVKAFDAVIVITPQESEMDIEYKIAIGTQSQIDNKREIPFSKLKGVYKKTLSHIPVGDADIFYIIMNSSKPMSEIHVSVNLNDKTDHSNDKQPTPAVEVVPTKEAFIPATKEAVKPSRSYLKYTVAIVIIAVGAYFLYNFWKKSKNNVVTAPITAPLAVTSAPVSTLNAVPVPTLVTANAVPVSTNAAPAPAPAMSFSEKRMSASSSSSVESVPTRQHKKPTFTFY